MKRSTDDTLRYVQFLARRFGRDDVRSVILVILLELGMAPHHDGFDYLRNAIWINFTESPRMAIKALYPTVGKLYGAGITGNQVDQAIRNTIRRAWNTRDKELWSYFFDERSIQKGKWPSNKEFIARITCILELWQSCEEVSYETK